MNIFYIQLGYRERLQHELLVELLLLVTQFVTLQSISSKNHSFFSPVSAQIISLGSFHKRYHEHGLTPTSFADSTVRHRDNTTTHPQRRSSLNNWYDDEYLLQMWCGEVTWLHERDEETAVSRRHPRRWISRISSPLTSILYGSTVFLR